MFLAAGPDLSFYLISSKKVQDFELFYIHTDKKQHNILK